MHTFTDIQKIRERLGRSENTNGLFVQTINLKVDQKKYYTYKYMWLPVGLIDHHHHHLLRLRHTFILRQLITRKWMNLILFGRIDITFGYVDGLVMRTCIKNQNSGCQRHKEEVQQSRALIHIAYAMFRLNNGGPFRERVPLYTFDRWHIHTPLDIHSCPQTQSHSNRAMGLHHFHVRCCLILQFFFHCITILCGLWNSSPPFGGSREIR